MKTDITLAGSENVFWFQVDPAHITLVFEESLREDQPRLMLTGDRGSMRLIAETINRALKQAS